MKVLYVEDNEQDADLTCRRLARLASCRAAALEVSTTGAISSNGTANGR